MNRGLWIAVAVVAGVAIHACEPAADGETKAMAARTARPRQKTEAATPRETAWKAMTGQVDRDLLPQLLAARAFVPPKGFKALVVRIDATPGEGFRYTGYDYLGTSHDREDWWPASSIKTLAAVAALEKTRTMGFTPRAAVTFHYAKGDVTNSLEWLVKEALIPSNNTAFDRLVEIVGFDWMNGTFLSAKKGYHDTVLLRGYSGRVLDPKTRHGLLRHSPAVTLVEGKTEKPLPERHGKRQFECPDLGNCTTLLELGDTIRRIVLHDSLPRSAPSERYALDSRQVRLLQACLEAERTRGMGVVNGLREAFGPQRPVRMYHKAGFALDWFSDAVLVHRTDTDERWLVVMAGYPGRNSLDDAARKVGDILVKGELPARP